MSEKLTITQKVMSGSTAIDSKREFSGDVGSVDKPIEPGKTIFVPVCFTAADLKMICLLASQDVRLESNVDGETETECVKLAAGVMRLWHRDLPEKPPFEQHVFGLRVTNLGDEPARLQIKHVS